MAKRILVTGAATGFGRGTALALAKRGHTVIAGVQIAPQVTELLKIADEARVQLKIQVLDITDEGDRQAAFANEVDVLINNAGVMQTGPVAEIPMEKCAGTSRRTCSARWRSRRGSRARWSSAGRGRS